MLYYPERVLLLGFTVYYTIYFLAPLTPTVEVHAGSVAFILLSCLGFVIGSQISGLVSIRKPSKATTESFLRKKTYSLFRMAFALGLLGNALRYIDMFILRGVGNLTGFAARESMLDGGGGVVSVIAGILYPFGFIPIFIYLGSRYMKKSRMRLILSLALFLIPAFISLVFASRSFALVAMAMIYFGASITLYRGKAFPRQLRLPILLAVGGLGLLSTTIFAWRLSEMDLDIVSSIILSAYGFTITPNDWALNILYGTSTATASMLLAILPMLQYYTHSLFEFQILWSEPIQQTFSYGALHFAPYIKLLRILGLASSPDMFLLFPRVGVFTSFFGPLWVDFGWFSPFFMMIFGFLARRIAKQAQRGDLGAYPLYTYICVVLFFAPVVNFIISAQGMYTINAFATFWFMSRSYAKLKGAEAKFEEQNS